MMGAESHHPFQDSSHLRASREEMESLALDQDDSRGDPIASYAADDYRSAMSSLSDLHHPLAASSPSRAPPSFVVAHNTYDNSNTTTTTTTTTAAAAADYNHSDPLLSPPSPLNSPKAPQFSDHSYLDPPSYADVVFNPNPSNGRSPCASSSSEYIKISVSDPQKEQETTNSLVPGTNTYVTYLITTRSNMPEFGVPESNVRRRFRDVVTLADRLAESYRGFFIPPRPDKNVVESQVMQKQEFVEQRRVALEKYLCKLAAHPEIKKSEELKVFLQVQGRLPLAPTTDVASRMLDGAVKLPRQLFGEAAAGAVPVHEVVQPAKGGRDLLRIFKELKQSVTNDWGGVRPAVVEEDKEFLERKDKMQDLEQQLSTASQQAESFVKGQQDIGETMGELGLAFVKLTKFETEEAVYNSQRIRAADYRNVATAAVKASRLYRESNAQTVKHLDTLHDYLGLMMAVHGAFSDRSSALLTVQTLVSELSSLHSKAEKLEVASSKIFGGDRTRIRKLEEVKETIRVTEDAKSCAVREYERIKVDLRTWNRDLIQMEEMVMIKEVRKNQQRVGNILLPTAELSLLQWGQITESIVMKGCSGANLLCCFVRKNGTNNGFNVPNMQIAYARLRQSLFTKAISYRVIQESYTGKVTVGVVIFLAYYQMMASGIGFDYPSKTSYGNNPEPIENNRNELERLDRERHDDFLNMLKGFVINQIRLTYTFYVSVGKKIKLASIFVLNCLLNEYKIMQSQH
ncbi:Sorting nexin 2B [Asimina triloba]